MTRAVSGKRNARRALRRSSLSGDDEGHFPVSRLRQQYTDYLAAKVLEYEEQKQSRHYYHGAQWTPEEIETLRRR